MPPKPESLSTIANSVQWYLQYSLAHFLPETVLVCGFLAVVLLNAFSRKREGQIATVWLSVLVLVASGVVAALQWVPQPVSSSVQWKAGVPIFPYTQTLFAPDVKQAEVVRGYGMAVVDNFAVFFKLLIALSGIFVLLMSLASREIMSRAKRIGDYSSILLGMSVGLYLAAASTDLIMMYLSLELVSIAGYVMAGISKDTQHGPEASLKYILFGALSSGLMLYGFSLLYGITGTTQIIAIRQVLALNPATHAGMNIYLLWLSAALVLAGLCYKISAVPFHFWTPDVYEGAPTPVAALLSVASKAGGFAVLLRFVIFVYPVGGKEGLPLINWPMAIAVISVLTMTFGNLAALLQSNLRRLLAYSSIAHAGYMLAGLAVNGPQGIVSIMIYLATYLFMQLGAFYCVMLIENKIGSEVIDDYRGIGPQMPFVTSALVLFLVSLMGIPLTAGFIGKLYLFTALITPNPVTHDTPWIWLAVAGVINSIVSLYYYLRVAGAMFLKRPLREIAMPDERMPRIPVAISQHALLLALVIPVIALGIYFQPLVDFASGIVRFFTFDNFKY